MRQIITLADDNQDGFLTYPEFLRIVRRLKFSVLNSNAGLNSRYYSLDFNFQVESAQTKPWLQASLQSYIRTFVPHHFQRSHEAVDGSYEQEYTCDPPAVTMILFSVLMVNHSSHFINYFLFYDCIDDGIFQILIYIFDKVSAHDTVSPKAFFFSIFVYNPFRRIEIWRFVTYMFVHAR